MSMKLKPKHLVAAALLMALHAFVGSPAFAEVVVLVPVPQADNAKASGALQTAVLAGGCFWGIEGVYEHVRGVRKVLSGYAGGEKGTAHYDAVSSGRTGHAEAVEVTFDPQEISYGEILRIFFSVAHDPTQLNRQGPDTGTQYRSAIFYADDTRGILPRATSRSSTSPGLSSAPSSHASILSSVSIRLRATTRTSSRRTPDIPMWCSTTCRRSAT